MLVAFDVDDEVGDVLEVASDFFVVVGDEVVDDGLFFRGEFGDADVLDCFLFGLFWCC